MHKTNLTFDMYITPSHLISKPDVKYKLFINLKKKKSGKFSRQKKQKIYIAFHTGKE